MADRAGWSEIEREWWNRVCSFCKSTGWKFDARDEIVTVEFLDCIRDVEERYGDGPAWKKMTRVLDLCVRERAYGPGGIMYPPDFQTHRDWLRAQERGETESRNGEVSAGLGNQGFRNGQIPKPRR